MGQAQSCPGAPCCRRCPWGPRDPPPGGGTPDLRRLSHFKSVYSVNQGGLQLSKGERLHITDQQGEWLQVEQGGRVGYIPRAFVAKEDSLEAQEWYFGTLTRLDAKRFLLQPMNMDGAFLVWRNEEVDCYYLSVRNGKSARHYQIQAVDKSFYLVQRQKFISLEKLVTYYSKNADGLCTKLNLPCVKLDVPSLPSLSHNTMDQLEIQPNSIEKIKKLGSGAFGNVWLAKWNGTIEVAIKELQVTAESMLNKMHDEAETMWKLNHPRVLKLYAVCLKADPVFIVTEYMKKGSLNRYLKGHKKKKDLEFTAMVDFAIQIAQGMAYLESKSCLHCDLRTDNILLTEMSSCKIGDFGLSSFTNNASLQIIGDMKLPIKWMAPEVFDCQRYSQKSDVWAFGILLVEILTYGDIPFPDILNQAYIKKLQEGWPLPAPEECPENMATIMKQCWARDRATRPTFKELELSLTKLIDAGLAEDSGL